MLRRDEEQAQLSQLFYEFGNALRDGDKQSVTTITAVIEDWWRIRLPKSPRFRVTDFIPSQNQQDAIKTGQFIPIYVPSDLVIPYNLQQLNQILFDSGKNPLKEYELLINKENVSGWFLLQIGEDMSHARLGTRRLLSAPIWTIGNAIYGELVNPGHSLDSDGVATLLDGSEISTYDATKMEDGNPKPVYVTTTVDNFGNLDMLLQSRPLQGFRKRYLFHVQDKNPNIGGGDGGLHTPLHPINRRSPSGVF